MNVKRMEVWWARLPHSEKSHIESGQRPVLIVSNGAANLFGPIVSVVPLTTRLTKKQLPTHVLLKDYGLRCESLALCEQIITLDKTSLISRIGYISSLRDQRAIKNALSVQLELLA